MTDEQWTEPALVGMRALSLFSVWWYAELKAQDDAKVFHVYDLPESEREGMLYAMRSVAFANCVRAGWLRVIRPLAIHEDAVERIRLLISAEDDIIDALEAVEPAMSGVYADSYGPDQQEAQLLAREVLEKLGRPVEVENRAARLAEELAADEERRRRLDAERAAARGLEMMTRDSALVATTCAVCDSELRTQRYAAGVKIVCSQECAARVLSI